MACSCGVRYQEHNAVNASLPHARLWTGQNLSRFDRLAKSAPVRAGGLSVHGRLSPAGNLRAVDATAAGCGGAVRAATTLGGRVWVCSTGGRAAYTIGVRWWAGEAETSSVTGSIAARFRCIREPSSKHQLLRLAETSG